MNSLLWQLEGGDRRSIGAVPRIVERVLADPRRFPTLLRGMAAPDALVCMRCADAVEKITRGHPEYLALHKRWLIRFAATAQQQELRWHLAQILPRLRLQTAERRRVKQILESYLRDRSRIVRALQGLADIAGQDSELRAPIVRRLEGLTETGSAAMRSRGRKLLRVLKRGTPRDVPGQRESSR
jgi:hypothetical protein